MYVNRNVEEVKKLDTSKIFALLRQSLRNDQDYLFDKTQNLIILHMFAYEFCGIDRFKN